MYKACIFDLDGTLANTLDSIVFFANSALEKCGYSPVEVSKFRYIVGNGADMLMRRMLNEACGQGNYTEGDVKRLRAVYDALYESNPTYIVTNYPGMQETLRALRRSGIKLAVLSNKPHNCTLAIEEALFDDGMFDVCYGQRPEVARKPSPQGALLIADELQVQPEECLYIGDTDTDMKTGSAAGMDTVGVLWGFRTRDELEQNHAKYIIKSPEEIKKLLRVT